MIGNPEVKTGGNIKPDKIIRTVCSPNCGGTCGINVFVKADRIIKVEPADYPDKRYNRICLKGIAMAMQRNNHPKRIRYPMLRAGKRGEGKWKRISWDEAFDYLAEKLTAIGSEYGTESAAWISMTGNYGIKAMTSPTRIANSLGGTSFSYMGIMGDLGCNMGFLPTMGVHTVAHDWGDLAGTKLILLFAKNVADTAHSEMHFLFDAMDAGARVVAIDTRFSRTAAKADQWISPRPGTDAALIMGIIKTIVDEGLFDELFLQRHTNAPYLIREDTRRLLRAGDVAGWDGDSFIVINAATGKPELAETVQSPTLHGYCNVLLKDETTIRCRTAFEAMLERWEDYAPEKATQICEVPADVIRQLAIDYATTKPATIWLGQGMQRYYHGHLAFRAAITLGALCGNIGKRHAAVSWIDDPLFRMLFSLSDSWLQPGGNKGRTLPGTRLHDIIATGEPYPIKSLWISNYGFGTQSPKFQYFVNECLDKLDLFAVTEQIMTPAAQYADIVLPCVTYYEDDMDLIGGAENPYVQLRRQAVPQFGEAKSDWDIFRGICERMGKAEGWQMTNEEVCRHYLETANDPLIRNIDWDELKREGVVRIKTPEPYIPFEDLCFPTPSGKLELYTESLREFDQEVLIFKEPLEGKYSKKAKQYPLCMLNNHQMYSAHSQHTILPWIRELRPEPVLDMHPDDARYRGINNGDLVRVFNDRGEFKVRVSLTQGIKQGVINMPQGWWPEHFPDKNHYTDLMHLTPNAVQDAILETNFAAFDNLVEIHKA